MDEHTKQIKALYDDGNESERESIKASLNGLLGEVEGPMDTLWKGFNGVMQLAVLRVGSNLNLFTHLANSKEPLSVTQLAELTGASPHLLARLLRYLSSTSALTQPTPTTFSPTRTSTLFTTPIGAALLIHGFDTVFPPLVALPAFLAKTSHADITDPRNTPFQHAFKTDLGAFEFLAGPGREKQYAAFQGAMTGMQSSKWVEGLDGLGEAVSAVSAEARNEGNEKRAFLVDVGGGHGHQCVQLLQKFPVLKEKKVRIVLEDLPEAVGKFSEEGKGIEGVEVVAQDFFEAQKVVGARFYYLRRIFHDWPATQSRQILHHLLVAMLDTPDSRILIDEVALPDTNVSWKAAMQDIAMMVQLGGVERSRSEWMELAEGVEKVDGKGLVIERFHEYDAAGHGCVVVLKVE